MLFAHDLLIMEFSNYSGLMWKRHVGGGDDEYSNLALFQMMLTQLLFAGLAISSMCSMPRRLFKSSCGKAHTVWYWNLEAYQRFSWSNICFWARSGNKYCYRQMSRKWVAESLQKNFIRCLQHFGASQKMWQSFASLVFPLESLLHLEVHISFKGWVYL